MIAEFNEFLNKRVEVICDNGKRFVGNYAGFNYDDEDECTYVYIECSANGCYELRLEEIISMKAL